MKTILKKQPVKKLFSAKSINKNAKKITPQLRSDSYFVLKTITTMLQEQEE